MPTDNKRLRCKKCGDQFTRPQGTNRLYCFACRPERKILEFPTVQDDDQPDEGPTMVDLTKKALSEAGVLETWQGMACVRLAQLIDENKHGASGAASNVKAHREAMAVAMADSGEDADIIDMIFNESS